MIKSVSRYIIHFLIIFFIQVLILNEISLLNLFHPYIYLIILIILPVNIQRGWLLIIAFFTGLIMDIFSYTYGMHTISCVLIGYLRPYVLRLFFMEDINEVVYEPHINTIGLRNFFLYVIILVLIHHFMLQLLESFTFHDVFKTLYKILINTILTVLFILIYEIIAFYKKE